MYVVFLFITVTHEGDENSLIFDFNRIIDSTVDIVIALLTNQVPIRKITKVDK